MKHFSNSFSIGIGLLSLLLLSATANASHIKAGEIIARRLDAQSLTYEITLRGYADRDSQVIFGSNGTLDFGDGTSIMLTNDLDPNKPEYIPRTAISEDTWMYELKINHTYSAAQSYIISFREFYRNEGILNMDESVNMPFYLETAINIDPFMGINNTPELRRAPMDYALLGKTYHHQPGGFDADGDSLSYRMVAPRQDQSTAVKNYRYPHRTFPAGDPRNASSETGGEAYFSINPVSGDIIWDAPGTAGQYNVAFQVVEWRKINGIYYQLGFVTRDMQIIVEDSGGMQPQLNFPFMDERVNPATGETLSWTITATAPSAEDSVVLEIWGDFPIRTDATISNRVVRAKGEATITIEWTGEENIGQHYQLIARSYYPATPNFTRNQSTYLYYNASDPLGVPDIAAGAIKVFPNPVTEQGFSISLPASTGKEVVLQLYNVKGQLVLAELVPAAAQQHLVRLPNATKGIYLLLLQHNGNTYRHKLIVQ